MIEDDALTKEGGDSEQDLLEHFERNRLGRDGGKRRLGGGAL